MIEWIVGAALLAGLFGSSREDKSRPGSAPPTSPHKEEEKLLADWRSAWQPSVDRKRWIPKSTASRIVKEFPPPSSYKYFFDSGTERAAKELLAEFADHNGNYLQCQKERLKHFFDAVEKNPLTDEQMDACICMDDAVQIVAAAGSGKTSTLMAKVGYALHEGLCEPQQIVVLAFNREVAQELRQRLLFRLGDCAGIEHVTVKTFNAFGLGVIGSATGRKPSLAPWSEPGRDVEKIVEIVETLRQTSKAFRRDWDMFRTVFGRSVSPGEKAGIQTAKGDTVKSEGERTIADWLFYCGVNYRYERPYELDTVTESYGQYRPDFYYPDIDLYHEHFALDANGEAPAEFGNYLDGVRWKRALHHQHGTNLFETTSHELFNGPGLKNLAQELRIRGLTLRHDPNRVGDGPPPVTVTQLAAMVRIFQQHVKSNHLTHAELRAVAKTGENVERQTRFVSLFERISDEWERQLREAEQVDFDDMLLMAAEHIESGRFRSPYRMILADEFQDTSRSKVRLLKALQQPGNAGDTRVHLSVVGDDWQSINRFAGADLSVMTSFEKVFDHATRLTLNTTFRCAPHLCEVSSAFVCANPLQIRKEVKTTSTYAKKSVLAFAAENDHQLGERLQADLQSMFDYAASGRLSADHGGRLSVLLLGRYNRDRPTQLHRWQSRFRDHLDIAFFTAHSSKGLEGDYVMLLNVNEGLLGFPSQITDDPLLHLAMPEPDTFPMAEERRLFYVALTRARRQVRTYSRLDSPSRFLIELAARGDLEIATANGSLVPCPKCQQGMLRRHLGKYGAFETCSEAPICGFKRDVSTDVAAASTAETVTRNRLTEPVGIGDACPICRTGAMVLRTKGAYRPFLACSGYPQCRTTAPYPAAAE